MIMSERRVFESLCMEPGDGGFSYDTALLVDVDRAIDFDEAVIRLITKCNSIITQLSTLGHPVTEFSIASSRVVNTGSKSPGTPEGRNLKAMEGLWSGLKRKNYSGMVAVARLSRSSIPRNGCGARYSVQTFKEALLSHIQAYFMFQAYNPMFQQWSVTTKDKEEEDAEYLIFLVYRIRASHGNPGGVSRSKRTRRISELEKLEIALPFPAPKRKRRSSSGSNVSSSSSVSSSGGGGGTHCHPPSPSPTSFLPPPAGSITPPPQVSPSDGSKRHDSYGLDWSEWPLIGRRGSLRSSVERESVGGAGTAGSHMVLRQRRGTNNTKRQNSQALEDG